MCVAVEATFAEGISVWRCRDSQLQGVHVNLVARHKAELTALCRRFGVRRLELFGSGQDAYFGLLESLEALLQRPVDLVVATAITTPYFRESVDETKTLVSAA